MDGPVIGRERKFDGVDYVAALEPLTKIPLGFPHRYCFGILSGLG